MYTFCLSRYFSVNCLNLRVISVFNCLQVLIKACKRLPLVTKLLKLCLNIFNGNAKKVQLDLKSVYI